MDKEIFKKVNELERKVKQQQEEIEILKKYILNNYSGSNDSPNSDKIIKGNDYYSDGGTMLL